MQLTNLKTKYLGRNFQLYNQIDSTQDEIWRLIKERQDRKWHTSYGRYTD